MSKKRTIERPGNDDWDVALFLIAFVVLGLGLMFEGWRAADGWYRGWKRANVNAPTRTGDTSVAGVIEIDGGVYGGETNFCEDVTFGVGAPNTLIIRDDDASTLTIGSGSGMIHFDTEGER